jgi:DNA-binding transcriptional regulator YiaG
MPTQKPRATNQQTSAQSYESYEPDSLAPAENAEPSDRQLDQPRRRRGRYPTVKRPATNSDLFPDGEINRMASNRLIWEGCNILTQGENLGWVQSGDGSPYYESPVAKGKGYVSFWVTNDLHAKHPAVLEGEAALALIEQFDIRAACMHLIYAAHATQLERPWEQSFVLSDTQLERYLGLDQNRNFKNKQQKLQLMLEMAKQPCHLLVYVSWPDQGKVKAFTVSRTWLWEIAEPMLHFQECLAGEDGQALGEKHLVGFTLRIRCGYWAQYFLNQERLQDKSGYYEYGILSQGVLSDIMSTWHHYEGAARLMTWLLFKTRVNRNSPLIVETLMKVAFGEKLVESAKEGFRQRAKLVRLWTTSLKVLLEKGWGLNPDPETYPFQYWPESYSSEPLNQIPDDPEQAAEFWAEDAAKSTGKRLTDTTKRTRASFEQLLSSKLWIQPPAAIAEKLDAIDVYRKPQHEKLSSRTSAVPEAQALSSGAMGQILGLMSPQAKTKGNTGEEAIELTGELVKQMRTARRLSQRDLASLTNISQKMISMIETGERSISSVNRERLLKAFQQQI